MYFRHHLVIAATLCSLAGCMQTAPTDEMGPIAARLSGTTLVSEQGWTFNLGADGQLSGSEADGRPIAGVWAERDGKFCRTLTLPEAWAGTACQEVEFDGDQVAFVRADGSRAVLTVQ
jgi:hypothetical protein